MTLPNQIVPTTAGIPVAAPDRPTVLIVDDTPANVALLGEVLQQHYRVKAATSGARALQIAAASSPDLILLDVMMPDMDGYEVLARLRGDVRTREVPVIFVTALDGTPDEEFGFEQGAVDYITKPLRQPIVLARVRTQLELKHARDILRNQNEALEAEVARRMAENVLIQDISIHALARLAEARDLETGNHLRRTQEYVRTLAQRLQANSEYAALLSHRTIDLLAKSAPLHDIGKVGVPDHILLKPGKLTADEWKIMKTHAAIGAAAIEQAERDAAAEIAFFDCAKQICRHHHEKWDGSGYPDALQGPAIPLPARLMALADVFDALISRRVYKAPLPFALARDYIQADRGRHFDPQVVDAFLGSFDEFCAIARRYADDDCDSEPQETDRAVAVAGR